MIKFYKILIRNFLSYGNNITEINLNFDDPTLIVGRNYDTSIDGQIDANGAGKSVILNALTYALYGKTISDIDVDKLIHFINKKNMEVTVIFEKGGTFYKVERYRKHATKGGNGVRYFESKTLDFEDTDDKTDSGIREANKSLEQIIGIPFDIFSRIVVFSATHTAFLSLPASHDSKSNQRDIIEGICGLTELSEKAERLKEETKNTKKELQSLILFQDQFKEELGRHTTQLDNARLRKEQWQKKNSDDIEQSKVNISLHKSINFEEQEQLLEEQAGDREKLLKNAPIETQYKSEIRRITDLISKASSWKLTHDDAIKQLEERIDQYKNINFKKQNSIFELLEELKNSNTDRSIQKDKLTTTISTLQKEQSKIETENEHLKGNNCPYCKQAFKDAQLKVDDNELKIVEILSSLRSLTKQMEKLNEEEKQSIEDQDGLKACLVYKTKKELVDIENAFNGAKISLENKLKEINPYENEDVSKLKEELEGININLKSLDTENQNLKKNVESITTKLNFNNLSELNRAKGLKDLATKELERLQGEKNPHEEVYVELSNVKIGDGYSDKIDETSELLEHQDFLIKLLTKKDSFIRKALLQKSLPFLNRRLKTYLDKTGLPHKVEFLEDMSVKISQFSNTLDYDNLSSGQKARVNLALSFAFRDVLQSRFGRINLCILDECLDTGLSNVGVTMAAKMIKSIAHDEKIALYVISHRDEISSMFNHKLEIELKNGFSNVVNEKGP